MTKNKKTVLIDFRPDAALGTVTRVAGGYSRTFVKGEGPFEVEAEVWGRERYLQKIGVFEEIKEKKKRDTSKAKQEVKDDYINSSQA